MDWVHYIEHTHPGVVELYGWLDSLAPFAREHELGRLDELMEAAAHGRLQDSGDALTPIKPVRVDPEIFELRHKMLPKAVRFYHGEPGELPNALIALHHHMKADGSAQEPHIQHAAERYADGRGSLWGTI